MPVHAPADKRFRRVRVNPRARRWWHPRWRVVAMAAGLAATIGYALVLSSIPSAIERYFAIEHVTVTGNHRLSHREVVAVLDGLRGRNVLTADLEVWRQRLKRFPWVADVTMRRVLPETIAVAVREREPVGIGRLDNRLYLIDRLGVIIDSFGPSYADLDLPIIDGLAPSPARNGVEIDEARAALAVRLLEALEERPDLSSRISQLDVSDVRDAVLLLKDDAAGVRMGHGQFVQRLQSYVDLRATLQEQVHDIDYVDLRFDERIYVIPRGGPGGTQAVRGSREP